jgi:hypothetical protein
MLGNCSVAEQLVGSQERLSSMKLIESKFIKRIIVGKLLEGSGRGEI